MDGALTDTVSSVDVTREVEFLFLLPRDQPIEGVEGQFARLVVFVIAIAFSTWMRPTRSPRWRLLQPFNAGGGIVCPPASSQMGVKTTHDSTCVAVAICTACGFYAYPVERAIALFVPCTGYRKSTRHARRNKKQCPCFDKIMC